MKSAGAASSAELDALREELQRVRRERDALAARVSELEQQCAVAAAPPPPEAAFEDVFRIEQARAKRHGQPLAVALLELDGLQELRDRLGHAAGEEALAHLGRHLVSCLRPTDAVARVDGLSWGVLLTATNLEQALVAMTRLHGEVAALPFEGGDTRQPLGFSAGLVQWRIDEGIADLMTRASRALGLARRAGGGRTVLG